VLIRENPWITVESVVSSFETYTLLRNSVMPIPALQEDVFLPPGLYLADLDEIFQRFGCTSERRRMLSNFQKINCIF
jgi:hypothetical protein